MQEYPSLLPGRYHKLVFKNAPFAGVMGVWQRSSVVIPGEGIYNHKLSKGFCWMPLLTSTLWFIVPCGIGAEKSVRSI